VKSITEAYEQKCSENSDISLFLPLLKEYGSGSDHITEMGVRKLASTWAFLAAKPNKLVSIDWDKEPYQVCRESLALAKKFADEDGIEFEFIASDSLNVEIEPTDLLFIDTWHTGEQLLLELILHSDNVSDLIIAHDTSANLFPGMIEAMQYFMAYNPQWEVIDHIVTEPGMSVMKRVSDDLVKGEFDKEFLLKEIEYQRQIYYSEVDENGSTSKAWQEYRAKQFEKQRNQEII
jgi:hypothetical protein